MSKYKLAVLTSHPIQHQAPLFKRLASRPEIDLTVYFCWNFGVQKAGYDKEMGREIKWDIPLLDGYKFKFLRNFSLKPSSEFWGQVNPGIIKELTGNKYDAVWILSWNSFTNWLAFFTAFFIAKTPVFLRGENPLNQELFKPRWKLRIKKNILGWLFKKISAFLYIGEENRKFYLYHGVPSSKLFFFPYSDDNNYYIAKANEFKPQKAKLRKEAGIKLDETVILFVGKLIDKKQPMDLLKSYHQLITHNSKLITQTVLLFVGDGALRSELEEYIKEHNLKNVRFAGFINLTELPKYYAMSDILVLPSGAGETWGLVVNIAMCFGMPVIVSDVAGCGPDLAKNGINGYIFPLGDVKELSQYLKELTENPKKRATFGEKSFEFIQPHSYEKDVEGILEALNKVVRRT